MEPEARIPSVSLTPGIVPPEELFWHWRRAISPYFDSIPLMDPRDPPQIPDVHMYNAGGFLFMDTKFSGQKFIRDRGWLKRNDDSDHIGLLIFLRGQSCCENGGSDFVLDTKGIYAVNLGYEVDALCSDAEVLTVILPRDRVMEELPGLSEARGLLFDRHGTSGTLLGGFLHSLRQVMKTAPARDAPILTESLLGMLRILLAAENPSSVEAHSGVRMALQCYIDQNLGSPEFGIDNICGQFQMSRATLYRVLAAEGGVRDYIQRRRLMGIFKALALPANMDRGVYSIALEYGFTSPSHLSTRFREHFGMTPKEVREAARSQHRHGNMLFQESPGNELSDAEVMERWARELRASGRTATRAAV